MDEHANDPFLMVLRANDLAHQGDIEGVLSTLVGCLGAHGAPAAFMAKFEERVRLLIRAKEEGNAALVPVWGPGEDTTAVNVPTTPLLPAFEFRFRRDWDAMAGAFKRALSKKQGSR